MPRHSPAVWSGLDSLESRQLLAFVIWDGGGGDADWNNPLNWSGDHLPGASDNVLIDAPGHPTIHRSAAASDTIASLWTLDPLDISAGSLTVNGEWRQSAALFVSGGQIHNAGNMIINGDALWIAGTIDGGGNILVYPGRQFSIGGNVTLGKSIYNNGSLRWSDGNITTNGGTIQNLTDRTFAISSGGTMSSSGAPTLLTNFGTFVRDGAAGTATTINVNFSNYPAVSWLQSTPGIVDVRAGTLSFTGDVAEKLGDRLTGAIWKVSSSTARLLLPGPDIATAFGTIKLAGAGAAFPQIEQAVSFGDLTLSGGRAFTFFGLGVGASIGNLTIDNPGLAMVLPGMSISGLTIHGGDVTFTGGLSGSAVVVDAGASLTLGGFSSFSNGQVSGAGLIRITGQLAWTGGDISGPGQLLVTASGSIITNGQYWGYAFKTLSRRTVNYGSITLAYSPYLQSSFSFSTEIVNRGVLNLQMFGFLNTNAGIGPESAPAYITNFGTINTYNTLTFRGAGGGVHLNNQGTVHVLAGSLTLNGGVAGGGGWTTNVGATLIFGGFGSVLTNPLFGGAGNIREAAGAAWTGVRMLDINQFVVTPVAHLTFLGPDNSLGSVSFLNQGSLSVGDATEASIFSNFVSSGTMDTGPGMLSIVGSCRLTSTSSWRVRSTFDGMGPRLTVIGALTLAGSINASFTWPAPVGTVLNLFSFGTVSGAFDHISGDGLPTGANLVFRYTGSVGQLVIVVL